MQYHTQTQIGDQSINIVLHTVHIIKSNPTLHKATKAKRIKVYIEDDVGARSTTTTTAKRPSRSSVEGEVWKMYKQEKTWNYNKVYRTATTPKTYVNVDIQTTKKRKAKKNHSKRICSE